MASSRPPLANPETRPRRLTGDSAVRTPTFCALGVSRCGATTVTVDGRFTALESDLGHPTGRALCVKGKAAPAILRHSDRVLHPLRRAAPKGEGVRRGSGSLG